MRLLTIIALWTIFVSCSTTERKDNNSNEFEKYLESLTSLKTPLTFATQDDFKERSPNYDSALFQKFKHDWSYRPLGKLFEKDSIIMTVEINVGDYLVPIVMTYDKRGNKLDSLSTFEKTGWDIGYESYEIVTINDNKEIVITDSTKTWDLNESKDDIIEGTEKLTVDTVIYRVDKKGKIKKIKD